MSGKRGMSMIETLVVVLVVGVLAGALMKILTGTFSSAGKGFQTLSTFQETSKFMAQVKNDLRTLIVGGVDNYPVPVVIPQVPGTGNTQSLEFCKVWNIHSSGRPLGLTVTYSRQGGGTPGEPFGITRVSGAGTADASEKLFVAKMLKGFRIEALDHQGVVINDAAQMGKLKKIRLSLETTGSELLSTTVSIYSPYLAAPTVADPNAFWRPNFSCETFVPGADVRVYQGGTIAGAGLTALGQPLLLTGETNLVAP